METLGEISIGVLLGTGNTLLTRWITAKIIFSSKLTKNKWILPLLAIVKWTLLGLLLLAVMKMAFLQARYIILGFFVGQVVSIGALVWQGRREHKKRPDDSLKKF